MGISNTEGGAERCERGLRRQTGDEWFDLTKQRQAPDGCGDALKVIPAPFFKQDDDRRDKDERRGQQSFQWFRHLASHLRAISLLIRCAIDSSAGGDDPTQWRTKSLASYASAGSIA
jgi:hypothetical protein